MSTAFTRRGLRTPLARYPRALLKAVNLDQSTGAGVGNVCADESLHLARIDPKRPAGSVTAGEVGRLHTAITTVLGAAVEHGGTSFVDYVNNFRDSGTHLARARVRQREGQPLQDVRNSPPTHPGRRPGDEHLPALPGVPDLDDGHHFSTLNPGPDRDRRAHRSGSVL